MTKKIIALLLLCCTIFCLLAACKDDGIIEPEEAQAIALKDMGISADQAEIHVHVSGNKDVPCFLVYVTYQGKTMAYTINAIDGTIVSKNESNHSH